MLIGFANPVTYTANIGTASWGAVWQVATDGYQAGKSIYNLASDPTWQWSDIWDITALLPFADAVGDFAAASRIALIRTVNRVTGNVPPSTANAVEGGIESADDWVRAGKNTETNLHGCNSFPEGTLVLMADGTLKPIEEVEAGDLVLADDPEDDLPAQAQIVVGRSSSTTEAWVHLAFDVDGDGVSDWTLQATPYHPIWTQDGGWEDAKEIMVGDLLWSQSGEYVEVVETWVEAAGGATTYDLDVEGIDTFFVLDEIGGVPILVHNTGPCDPWKDLDDFNNWDDPVQDAVEHILRDHPERIPDLGLRDANDLQDFIDDLYNNAPQVWVRPDGATAYVDPQRGIFINNPIEPTVIPPRADYRDYLNRDDFTPN